MSDYTYTKGTILVIERGAYSDFEMQAILVSLVDADMEKLAVQWWESEVIAHVERRKINNGPVWRDADSSGFVAWLCANQIFAQVNHSSLHIGTYGSIEFGDVNINVYDFDEDVEARLESAHREEES